MADNVGEGQPCNGTSCPTEQDGDHKKQTDQSKINEDYLAARERINSGLHKIRLELSEIRDQDVKLLKQLVQISETIKKISDDRLSKRRTWYGQRQSLCSETSDLYIDMAPFSPDMDEYRDAILFRQFSEPTSFSREIYLNPTTSTAMFDASVYLANGNHDREPQQNWGVDFSKVPLRHRPHSVSIVRSEKTYSMDPSQEWPCQNDKSYAELLERSIHLWKSKHCDSQSEGNDERLTSLINEYMKSDQDQKTNSDRIECSSKEDSSKDNHSATPVAADTATAEAARSAGDKEAVRPLSRSTGTSFNLCGHSGSVEKPKDDEGECHVGNENGIRSFVHGVSFPNEVCRTAEKLEKTDDKIENTNSVSTASSNVTKAVCDSVPNLNDSQRLSNAENVVRKDGDQPVSNTVHSTCSGSSRSPSNNHTSTVLHQQTQQSAITELKNIR